MFGMFIAGLIFLFLCWFSETKVGSIFAAVGIVIMIGGVIVALVD